MILISGRIGEKGLSKGEIIRSYHECDGGIEKSVPGITVWHHEACPVMANGYREGLTFLSHLHTKNIFFFLVTIQLCFVMHYFFAIILERKRKLVVLQILSYRCIIIINVLWLFLRVPWIGLQCAIVVVPDHTHLHFFLSRSS